MDASFAFLFLGADVIGNAAQVRDAFIAQQVQQLACPGASCSALAVDEKRLALIGEGFLCLLQNPAHGKIHTSGDMARIIFAGVSDVHQKGIGR